MVYKVIGLMSGSSLDGLDIVCTLLEEVRGKWAFEIKHAACISYPAEWAERLKAPAKTLDVPGFLRLHTSYGRYIGEQINDFIQEYELEHKVDFIASHGHTAFHEPENQTTVQIGDGATIAALTGLPVISDLRAMDVALGGHGAPIVPIGDQLLFADYDYRLNIGGIANITVPFNDGLVAFDICTANQALNALANREGKEMDESGAMAAQGNLLPDVLEQLNTDAYYAQAAPKSLSNDAAIALAAPLLNDITYTTHDLLHTAAHHIAQQIAMVVQQYPHSKEQATLLATGGGAFNTFLIMQLQQLIAPLNVTVVVPEDTVVKYKEALIMALIGTLRWREEVNVLSSVTGAARDSVGGALWLG